MIYEKKCPYCGIEFKTDRENQIFCCLACVNKGRASNDRGNFDHSLEWKRHHGKWDCPYQESVGCYVRNCDKCGWNPDVAKARLKKYMEEHHEG